MRGYVQLNNNYYYYYNSQHNPTTLLSYTITTTTSSNRNHMARLQERDQGAAVGNYDSQQQATSSRQDPLRNIGANVNDRDRRENGEGVTSGTQEKGRSNDSVEEVDEIEVGN